MDAGDRDLRTLVVLLMIQADVKSERKMSRRMGQNGPPPGGGAVYGLGMIGALAYFLGRAVSGRDYLLALPKATVWPALLVYKLLKTYYG